MILDFNTFATLVVAWCEFRGSELSRFFPLKGGWEAWVQADWAAYALQQNSTYDILRETPVYNNAEQRASWLFNSTAPALQKLVIELECQSFDNSNTFTAGLQTEINMLQQGNLNANYTGCQTGVMGIYFEEQERAWVLDNGFIEVFNNGDFGCAIKKLS